MSCVGLAAAICAFFLIEMKNVGRWSLVFWGVVFITLSMRMSFKHITLPIIYLEFDWISHSWHRYCRFRGSRYHHRGSWCRSRCIRCPIQCRHCSRPWCRRVRPYFSIPYSLKTTQTQSTDQNSYSWAYAGESGSVRLRAKTTTLATGGNAIIGTVTNIVIPFELAAIGPKTGYMFFGFGVICCVLIYIWIPDVTGRTYAQLDELFERKILARKFKETVCTGNYGLDQKADV